MVMYLKQRLFWMALLLWLGAAAQPVRQEKNFDANWLFARYGLQPDGSRIAEPGNKEKGGGNQLGLAPQAIGFNDAGWRKLDLPHDWGVEGPFRPDLDGNTGKLPWRAIGWYRKHFKIQPADKLKQFYLDFDGAMANAQVWLNGHKVGDRPYGYSSFRVDLTPYLLFGKDNVLAVRLNTEDLGSRWYPGGGIYRNVRLVITNPVHIAHWGVFVTTSQITKPYAKAKIAVTINNDLAKSVDVQYAVAIYALDKNDQKRNKVAQSEKQTLHLNAHRGVDGVVNLQIAKPKLWDLKSPNRYLACVSVYDHDKKIDQYNTSFGFRTIEFTHDNGFLLNGQRVQLQGTCNHSDYGALGTVVNRSAIERKLTILKNMGCNALRTSHNPPSAELLSLADKMGFLVMDEAFDCFQISKDANGNDYARHFNDWHERDLESMVKMGRNHPSVIMWSMGNEIPEQYDSSKFYLFAQLRDIIHHYDSTRPVTCGISAPDETAFHGLELIVDVHGMNYPSGVYGGPDFYGKFLHYKNHEHIAGFASETSSDMSSRGVYFPKGFQMSSYDLKAPGWGSLPDAEFAALDKYPAICGEFVWTGFDYLGEPTPFNSDASLLLNYATSSKDDLKRESEKLKKMEADRPTSRSSYFGIVDLAGFPKDRYYLYQAKWRPNLPMVHILPHWNFADRIGKVTPVFVYTSGDEAELFLNGRSLGRKKKQPYQYRLRWNDVKYEPGELKAVAYKGGKKWATTTVNTTKAAAKLRLSPSKPSIAPDGNDLVFIKIEITDKDGRRVPTAHNLIHCYLKSEGKIVATDNGDATCLISFPNPIRPAFNGLMLAIVKAEPHQKENLKLVVEAQGLEKAIIEIPVNGNKAPTGIADDY
ncbi:beta-galactosidase GalB [Arachidicoccus sp.]|uniref:beta-galactosidase GalB n=1 Tax=Arachidicoccus sp. TaxID=1872624 RepID=UPI003D24C835